jgi:alanyl-tRNA synthetase
VENSAEINIFKIVSEGGIAAGVRRIIGVTSEAAYGFLNDRYQESKYVRERLKANSITDIEHRLDSMAQKEKELRKQIDGFKGANLGTEVDRMIANAKIIGGTQFILNQCDSDPNGVKLLREVSDRLRQKAPSAVVVLGMEDKDSGKAFLLAAVGKDAPAKIKANEIIQELAPIIEGRGGGKADMAQAGGVGIAGLPKAMAEAERLVSALLAN